MDEIVLGRTQKKQKIEEAGVNPYPSYTGEFKPMSEITTEFEGQDREKLEELDQNHSICGRVILIRDFGKAAFFTLRDQDGSLQAWINKKKLKESELAQFESIEIGDIVKVFGRVGKTKKGELTIFTQNLKILSKSLRPLPEKFHGLTDKELRYRMRYVDLIANPEVRDTFKKRSLIISKIRDFFWQKGFLEFETPMMQTLAGGAAAKPFVTHHNALGIELFMRVAPELYLKRLLVGGFEKVFELNRNFRNEGLSPLHNPEFTMIEFYQAYATYEDFMALTEELISKLAIEITGSEKVTYQEKEINFSAPFKRMTMKGSVAQYSGVSEDSLTSLEGLQKLAKEKNISTPPEIKTYGKLLVHLFEEIVEEQIWDPVFITEFPLEISPLSKKNSDNPDFVDRFELFVGGFELANAFNELNDPIDQRERFKDQMESKKLGDDEAMPYDEDFVKALEHGMPPAAGQGIGIDRLVMLLTNSASIRDVIAFPLMRPEK